MKKKILITSFFVGLFSATLIMSFKAEQQILTASFPAETWAVYFRNAERMSAMAGRGDVPSHILLATKDTLNFINQNIFVQLNKQISDTTKKK